MTELREGWLDRQAESVRKDIAEWPEWMKREIEKGHDVLCPRVITDEEIKRLLKSEMAT